MLEAKHLFKSYKTKNGPEVKALDDVSVSFQETGMVFILGKSGSGKSTLLNVLGGLDKYDSGEIIVKGKSSKDFSQADFDSYRNTFVGFIFQEYNILEEFTINKNIGLALELQGKKADKEAINNLIEQVDLKGYGNRKPNTLSGGQRQRVAIARALIKNPEIIMADEPTGALDSNTGKQVLDTLKNLSKTKLVIIVSHDREFAEYYGDRIIELADGKIISDVSKYKSAPTNSDGLEIVDNQVLTIKKGTKLDAKKVKTLNDFISSSEEDVIVSIDQKANKEFKKYAKIDEEGNKESFKNTDKVDLKEYDEKEIKLIRSKLPGTDSFKMGASSLKHKPIRLFFTIILAAIAFCLFGLCDTMSSYDKVANTIKSIQDSKINYASFSKQYKQSSGDDYFYYNDTKLSEADYETLSETLSDNHFIPVYGFSQYSSSDSFSQSIFDSASYDSLYRDFIAGYAELSEEDASAIGTLVAGRLPNKDDEMAITKYTFDVFKKYSYRDDSNTKIEVNDFNDILNKEIRLNGNIFKIVGIIDTDFDLSRYASLDEANTNSNDISYYMLSNEFRSLLETSFHALGFLNEGYYQRNIKGEATIFDYIQNSNMSFDIGESYDDTSYNSLSYLTKFSSADQNRIIYFGEAKSSLAENEVIITANTIRKMRFMIDNREFSYDDIIDSYDAQEYFKNDFATFLVENEIDYDMDSILTYYNAFDYYNLGPYLTEEREKWGGSWYQVGDLTPEQKELIDNFLTNYEGPNYYINLYNYFAKTYRNEFMSLYEARQEADPESSLDIYSYISQMQFYFSYFSESYFDFDLTDGERVFLNKVVDDILAKLQPYMGNKIFIRESYEDTPKEYTIVGVYNGEVSKDYYYDVGVISDTLYEKYKGRLGGVYNFVISKLDYNDNDNLTKIVEFSYKDGDIVYRLSNPVMTSMEQINDLIETLSQAFLYVAIGFAVFASLLLLNFITLSISYKKREIGILRAIGARGMDVFKIFFNESFIIAFINFVLALAGSFLACFFLNRMFRNEYGLLITILNIGIRQILLMFAISLLVAVISSAIPVSNVARKKPIDAIRNS